MSQALLAGIALAVAVGSGCYNPHVQSGGLVCASTSPQCPDGFSCVSGLCVAKSGSGAGGGAGTGGTGGGGGGTCANPIAPLCTPVQTAMACDPACQTGCPCGQRCQVAASGPKCVTPAGTLTLGMVCKPEADACAPGYTCLQEACGSDLGRCYRFCNDSEDPTACGATVCGTPVLLPNRNDSGQRVCNLGTDATCDPVSNTGCVDPALRCYVTGPTQNTCDCPSGANKQEGDTCVFPNDCLPGLACLSLPATTPEQQAQVRCVKLCQVAADCPATTCQSYAPTFGYCQPAD